MSTAVPLNILVLLHCTICHVILHYTVYYMLCFWQCI